MIGWYVRRMPEELPVDRLRALAEDAEDARAAIAARREIEDTGELPVRWEEVKAELRLM